MLLTSKLPLISPAFGDGLFVMWDAVLRALTGGWFGNVRLRYLDGLVELLLTPYPFVVTFIKSLSSVLLFLTGL